MIIQNTANAADYTVYINESNLPSVNNISINVYGIVNTTPGILYDDYLSGPTQIYFEDVSTNVIDVSVNIPLTIDWTNHISQINLTNNNSYSIQFVLIDDVIFNINVPEYAFVGSSIDITPTAPTKNSVNLYIENKLVEWDGITPISYEPQYKEKVHVKGIFFFRNHTTTIDKNFSVYDRLSCQISSTSVISENESILFLPQVEGGIGSMTYKWDFDDGDNSNSDKPNHVFIRTGEYDVDLRVTDEEGYSADCSKKIDVEENTYTLTIYLKDNETGNFVGDANVTLDETMKKSNVNGKVKFSELLAGDYDLEIQRDYYLDYDENLEIDSDKTIYINYSKIPEEKRPTPEIELLYPDNEYYTASEKMNFDFRVYSETEIQTCYLLFNDKNSLGYKIEGTIEDPINGNDYSFNLNLTNGFFKWNVQCENTDGANKSIDRSITVSGLQEFIDKDANDITPVESVVETNINELQDLDFIKYNELIQDINDFNKEIVASPSNVQFVFENLGIKKALDDNLKDIKELRQKMIDLNDLKISEFDRNIKKSEFDSEFRTLKSSTPIKIIVSSEKRYELDTENNDITSAVAEFLAWKNINLTKRELSRYEDRVKENQKELSVLTHMIIAEITFSNGETSYYNIMSKELIVGDVPGIIIFEIIPKNVAEHIDQVTFDIDYQVVNEDPIVRIFNNEKNNYIYFTNGYIDRSEFEKTSTVLLLDLDHPKNKITGFSILDTSTGQGKLFLVVIMLTVVISGNYFIFFREKTSRNKLITAFSNVKNSLKVRSNEERLTLLLNNIVDELNLGQTKQAIGRYPVVLDLYDKVNRPYRKELKPIIEHLYFELEIFNLNSMIEDSYQKTIRGKWFEAVDSYNEIHDNVKYIPKNLKSKISSNFPKLNLAMDIHMMKVHPGRVDKKRTVDDSLYGVRK